MYTIATLEGFRRQLGLAATDDAEDALLLDTLSRASDFIESFTQRRFCPYLKTLQVRLDPAQPRELILPDDLLELRALSIGGSNIDMADIRLLPDDRDGPASLLALARDAPFQAADVPERLASIDGVWGWHNRWSTAWRESGDKIGGSALDAIATSFTVADSAGSDSDGWSPRFQVGHLLRIESEFLRVIAIDRSNHTLTALRGAQGTLAVTHQADTSIETYAPAQAIRDLTLRYAELMLKSAGLVRDEPAPLLERLRRLTA